MLVRPSLLFDHVKEGPMNPKSIALKFIMKSLRQLAKLSATILPPHFSLARFMQLKSPITTQGPERQPPCCQAKSKNSSF